MIYINRDLEPSLYQDLVKGFSQTAHKERILSYESYINGDRVKNSYPRTIVHFLSNYLFYAGKQMFTASKDKDRPAQDFLHQFFRERWIYKIFVDLLHMVGSLGQGFLFVQIHPKRGFFDYTFSLVSPLDVLQIIDIRDQKKAILLRTTYRLYNKQEYTHYTLFTEDKVTILDQEGGVIEEKENLLKTVPLIFFDNPSQNPDYFKAIDAIEKLDLIQNEDVRVLKKLFDSILVTSMRLDEEKVAQLQNLRVIDDLGPDARFEIHTYDPEHEYRKHLKEYYINEIFLHTGLFDFSQIHLGADISGTALQYKIYPMKLFADQKEASLKIGVYKLLGVLQKALEIYPHYLLGQGYQWNLQDLDVVFHRNLPKGDHFTRMLSLKENISVSTLLDQVGLSYEHEKERRNLEESQEKLKEEEL